MRKSFYAGFALFVSAITCVPAFANNTVTITTGYSLSYADIEDFLKNNLSVRLTEDGTRMRVDWKANPTVITIDLPPVVNVQEEAYFDKNTKETKRYYSKIVLAEGIFDYYSFEKDDLYRRLRFGYTVTLNTAYLTEAMIQLLKQGARVEGSISFNTTLVDKNFYLGYEWPLSLTFFIDSINGMPIGRR